VTDLQEILVAIQNRVYNALFEFSGKTPEVSDLNARKEPSSVPYARVGIAEVAHSDFTVSSDSLMIGIQLVAVVNRNGKQPQEVQFELARVIHFHLFGENYESCLLELSSGRVARLIPSTRTTFFSDVEQAVAERVPDCTSVVIVLTVELPLGGKVF
jgi:hypothetical protein